MSLARRVFAAFSLACVLASGAGCKQRPADLREWRPADHSREDGEDPFDPSLPPLEDNDPTTALMAVFAVQCANCHGPEGHGDGPAAQGPVRPPDFTLPAFQAAWTDAALRASIASGRNAMPAFGQTLSREAIDGMVELIRSMGHPRPQPARNEGHAPLAPAHATPSQ